RVYSKLDSDKPIILRKPATIKDFCLKIHKEFLSSFKNARVFGKSVKFQGQVVGLNHKLENDDVIEVKKKQ
ncbi:MAG: TGS domain-containing protein, partial [archaeon]